MMKMIMKLNSKSVFTVARWRAFLIILALLVSPFMVVTAQPSNANYTAVPPITSRQVGDIEVLLTLSLDHQLFLEAYNDYDDIYQEPGELTPVPETTYTHAVDYVGYFNSNLCYLYNQGRFQPGGPATNKYCVDGVDDGGWSGNFLNWVSMTRIDLVRHVLYGGYRSTDGPNLTILERAYLPQDTHSFAKYYAGADIADLTDGLPLAETCQHSNAALCEGYTFCNTTKPISNQIFKSQDAPIVQSPPLIRAVKGNYSLWASNERFQCITIEEIPDNNVEIHQAVNGVNLTEAQKDNVRNNLGYFIEMGVNGNNDPTATGINAHRALPKTAAVTDFIARVQSCNFAEVTWEANNKDTYDVHCEGYTNFSHKPIGLLQGKNVDHIKFGLLTGSYVSNKDYGIVRKNLARFGDEVNSDGTFYINYLPQNTSFDSIVGSLNALRIIDYEFNGGNRADRDGTYRGANDGSAGECNWAQSSFNNNKCRNWGNPFSELLTESYRYFVATAIAGVAEPSIAYDTGSPNGSDEQNIIDGLSVVSEWPTTNNNLNACRSRNVLAFNASGVSYDDSIANSTIASLDLGTANTTVAALTDVIGTSEIVSGATYFVGSVTGATGADAQCTAKTITQLSLVRGVCPETPRLDGTYLGAGLAHYMHTTDFNPDTPEKDTIATYGVTLAGALPNITVNANGKTVVIIPACQNLGETAEGATPDRKGNCALVEFKPLGNNKYYVGWEDSEQGGDYDLDISGIISTNVVGSQLQVDTQIIYESANDRLEFGFAISGTGLGTQDTVYFPSFISFDNVTNDPITQDTQGINREQVDIQTLLDGNTVLSVGQWSYLLKRALYLNESQLVISGVMDRLFGLSPVDTSTATAWCTQTTPQCEVEVNGDTQTQRTKFDLNGTGSTPGTFLKDPLYYATKWGSFKDSNSDNIPNVDSEWASNEMDPYGDPMPKGYASIKSPQRLKQKLADIINELVVAASTGTGSGVSTNTLTGEGLALQTFYTPDINDGAVSWVGSITGLLRDRFGNLREDSNNNGRLDDPASDGSVTADKAVRFVYDASQKKTVAQRCDIAVASSSSSAESSESSASSSSEPSVFELGPSYSVTNCAVPTALNPIKYLWDANKTLNDMDVDKNNAEYPAQRSFSSSPASGRYIFTAIDGANSQPVDGFVKGTEVVDFESNATDLATIAPFLDVTSNTVAANVIDFIRGKEGITGFRSRTDGNDIYRLGDVIHSSPTVVGRPTERYARNDDSYLRYAEIHRNRRQVAYVGGNDGLLHAFNVGFFNPANIGFYDGHTINGDGDSVFTNGASGPTTLGQERWAYAPFNLLPHLKWLTSPSYSHVYYMDGPIQAFDVNIFTPDNTTYIGGWGTIIVAGMRFGGGDYTINAGEVDEATMRSGYVILDVTDPEVAPKLLGEITHASLGYTLSNVDVIVRRSPNTDPVVNKWSLVFGSGPQGSDGLTDGVSDESAKLFVVDLEDLAGGTLDMQVIDTGIATSFVGGVTVQDWNGDYFDDAVYFGLVGSGTTGNKGRLMYANINASADHPVANNAAATLLSSGVNPVDLPFSAAPVAVADVDGNRLVYAASGRYYVEDDLTGTSTNRLFGINVKHGVAQISDLVDVTNFEVFSSPSGSNVIKQNTGNATTPVYADITLGAAPGTPITDMASLTNYINNYASNGKKGWVRDFARNTEKSFLSPLFLNDTVYASTFSPAQETSCEPSGTSYIYALDMYTGLAQIRRIGVIYDTNSSVSSGGETLNKVDPIAATMAGQIVALLPQADSVEGITNAGVPEEVPGGIGDPIPGRESWREVEF